MGNDFLMWLLWTILQFKGLLYFLFFFKQRHFAALEDMKCGKVFALSFSWVIAFFLWLIFAAVNEGSCLYSSRNQAELVSEGNEGWILFTEILDCTMPFTDLSWEWRRVTEGFCISCGEASRRYFSRSLCHQLHFSFELFRNSYQNC